MMKMEMEMEMEMMKEMSGTRRRTARVQAERRGLQSSSRQIGVSARVELHVHSHPSPKFLHPTTPPTTPLPYTLDRPDIVRLKRPAMLS